MAGLPGRLSQNDSHEDDGRPKHLGGIEGLPEQDPGDDAGANWLEHADQAHPGGAKVPNGEQYQQERRDGA